MPNAMRQLRQVQPLQMPDGTNGSSGSYRSQCRYYWANGSHGSQEERR